MSSHIARCNALQENAEARCSMLNGIFNRARSSRRRDCKESFVVVIGCIRPYNTTHRSPTSSYKLTEHPIHIHPSTHPSSTTSTNDVFPSFLVAGHECAARARNAQVHRARLVALLPGGRTVAPAVARRRRSLRGEPRERACATGRRAYEHLPFAPTAIR